MAAPTMGRAARRLGRAGAASVAIGLLAAPGALANHPVLLEGNCNAPSTDPMFFSAVPAPGTCGDYDGDGRIGPAEDTDNDRVFGTLGAANVGTPQSINNNGKITVVTSGTFAEQETFTGNVTLEGAPGVEANIEAFRQGDPPADNAARQAQPGIIVNAPANRYVILRNIQSRNWTSGIRIIGDSRVALEDVRAEHNVNYGVEVEGNAKVAISGSEIQATGFRVNPASGDFPSNANRPSPGIGIAFEDRSRGTVCDSSVTGNFAAGISGTGRNVSTALLNVFDNRPDLQGVGRPGTSCIGDGPGRGGGNDDDDD